MNHDWFAQFFLETQLFDWFENAPSHARNFCVDVDVRKKLVKAVRRAEHDRIAERDNRHVFYFFSNVFVASFIFVLRNFFAFRFFVVKNLRFFIFRNFRALRIFAFIKFRFFLFQKNFVFLDFIFERAHLRREIRRREKFIYSSRSHCEKQNLREN